MATSLINPDFTEIVKINFTSRVDTPLIRPLFHYRMSGLIRGETTVFDPINLITYKCFLDIPEIFQCFHIRESLTQLIYVHTMCS
jgi:hypothetical protein